MNDCQSNKIEVGILAAGLGTRMGMPKWKALLNNKTFLQTVVEKLYAAGLMNLTCVIREEFECDVAGIRYVINQTPEFGMISSVYYLYHSTPHSDYYLIYPVDHPFVEVDTVKKLINAVNESDGCYDLIKPFCNNRGGHPIIISNRIASRVPSGDYEGGLRKILTKSNAKVKYIPLLDPGILKNINRKEDIK